MMIRIDITELPQRLIEAAVDAARDSGCQKSKRGAVAFDVHTLAILGVGANAPVVGTCTGSAACREACSKICVHAEVLALRRASFTWSWQTEVDIVHAKIVDDKLVPGGGPSCWQCARDLRLDRRVLGVWLFHESGWRRYPIAEFHELTMSACGLDQR